MDATGRGSDLSPSFPSGSGCHHFKSWIRCRHLSGSCRVGSEAAAKAKCSVGNTVGRGWGGKLVLALTRLRKSTPKGQEHLPSLACAFAQSHWLG